MFKSLLRTIPTLSGNITLNCKLNRNIRTTDSSFYDYDSYVRSASLEPLQNIIYSRNIDVNLAQGSWEFDVPKYYKYYNNYFYKTNFSFNKEDYQVYDSLVENNGRNKEYEWGCKRITYSKHGYQMQFYAPIYIDDYNDIPDYFELILEFDNTSKKTIRIWLNKENKDNYLRNYLLKYVKKIDSHVIYCLHDSNQATLYGINVISGGFTTIKDDVISIIYNNQMTQNNFDFNICSTFSRNKIIMKQILPLSFSFNIDDFLNNSEKMTMMNNVVKIYGHYVKNSIEQQLYDFSRDYKEYYPNILLFDPIYKSYKYFTSDVNVLDVDYPSLHEKSFDNYKYSNLLTTQYTRWKMESSSDENPYITNMSFGFTYSSIKSGSNKYGEFPSLIYDDEIDAHIVNDKLLTNTIDNYDSIDNIYYNRLQNNYLSSWYELGSSDIISYDLGKFKDVKDNTCLFNGILYNFNNLYDSYGELINIDKFSVILRPELLLNDSDNDNIISVKYLYSKKTSEQLLSNCYLYSYYIENDSYITSYAYLDVYQDEMSYNYYEEYSQLMKVDPMGDYVDLQDEIKNIYYRKDDLLNNDDIDKCISMPRLIDDMSFSNFNSDINQINDPLLCNSYVNESINKISDISKDIFKSTSKYNFFINDTFVSYMDVTSPENIPNDCIKYEYVTIGSENGVTTEKYMKKIHNSYISYNDVISSTDIMDDYIYCDSDILLSQLYNLKNSIMSEYICGDNIEYSDSFKNVCYAYDYVNSSVKISSYIKLTNLKELKWSIRNNKNIYNRCISYDDTFIRHNSIDKIDTNIMSDYFDDRDSNIYNMFSLKEYCSYFDIYNTYLDLFTDTNCIVFTKELWDICNDYSLFPHLYKKWYGNDKNLSYPLMEYKLPYKKYDNESEDVDNLLIPLFYDIDSVDESIDKYNNLRATNKIKFINNNCIYRDFDILYMYNENYANKTRYSKFDLMNGSPTQYKYDGVKYYDKYKLNVYEDGDGVKYGFFYIDFKLDNTTNSFNIDQDLFTYVNDTEFTQENINDVFRSIHPYLKDFIFNDFYNKVDSILVKPTNLTLKIIYKPYVIDNTDTKVSYLYNGTTFGITKDTYEKNFIINRYFSYITPLIVQTNNINNIWELRYKKINTTINSNNIYDTNTFPITKYNGVNVAYEYDNVTHEVQSMISYDYEYKHFNDSHYYGLCDIMETSLDKYVTYDELSNENNGLETPEETLKQFKNCLKKYNRYSTYDENEILFLFNKYNVVYLSKPIKLNNISTEKLYSLIYKFTLK